MIKIADPVATIIVMVVYNVAHLSFTVLGDNPRTFNVNKGIVIKLNLDTDRLLFKFVSDPIDGDISMNGYCGIVFYKDS